MNPRHLSLRKSENDIGKLRGPNGRRLCRWCGKEVSPPRRTFCSDICSHEWRLRSSGSYLRERVYERDRGVCQRCGRDTRQTKTILENEQTAAMRRCGVFGPSPLADWRKDPLYLAFLRKPPLPLTVKEAEKSLWQADHIVEVAEGGGTCGLENLRTLCLWCHKEETKSFMKLRKAAPKLTQQVLKIPGAPRFNIDDTE